MIREENVKGIGKAIVAYLSKDFKPVDPENAELIKVIPLDGRGVVFLSIDKTDNIEETNK